MKSINFNNVRQDIQGYINRGEMFGANIIVAQRGEILLRESFGTTDGSTPLGLDHLFLLMSVSKSYTAVLTLNAIEKGWFSLNTRIAEISPEFAANGKENITIFHILTHQAGIFGMPMLPETSPMDMGNIDVIFTKLAAMPADFPAGTKASYSAFAGYAVLGKTLEKCDPKQRTFAQIAEDELFKPLKMTASSFGNAENNPKRVAVSHTEKEKAKGDAHAGNLEMIEKMLNLQASNGFQIPAGNAFSTIDDLFRFAENLRLNLQGDGVRMLSPAMARYATQNHCGEMLNEIWQGECQKLHLEPLQARFGLHGGYVRGTGHHLNVCGFLASPMAFAAMGGGSTMYLVDPERELTVAFVSAGFIEGLPHLLRLSKMNDLILGALG